MSSRIDMATEIESKPARVFEALIRAPELEQWFAERAYVSETDGSFDFWGRHTPGNPDREAGRHSLVALERDRRIAFRWTVRGTSTTVEIALAPSGQGTKLTLRHDAPPRDAHEMSLADFWLLSLENLRRFVDEGKAPMLCDYSTTPRGGVELVVDIEAPPAAVFGALSHPDSIDRWMQAKSTVDLRAGGRIDFGWGSGGPVRILSIVPNEKLSYGWAYGEDPETIVTWTLEGSGTRPSTRLTLVHSGFGERDVEDFRTGWLKHLAWMKALVEKKGAWVAPANLGGHDA
jgi:uncharacterized protein YndB with AHSA1/START domain